MIADLAGDVSTQQSAMIDLCVKSKLMLDSIDAWLLTQPSLINKRKKTVLPVVRERQALADGLARYLAQLGLHRTQREKNARGITQQRLRRIYAQKKTQATITRAGAQAAR